MQYNLLKRKKGVLYWLNIRRSKTKIAYKIPLLPKASEIIKSYKDEDEVLVFKNISNWRFNEYLKEIVVVVGIKKKLTHHMARKIKEGAKLLDITLLDHIIVTKESYSSFTDNRYWIVVFSLYL